MINLIENTPIADLIPLGNGLFKGEAQDGNRTLSFVISMTRLGNVIVKSAVFRVSNQAVA
jgi:hypothetical protein